MPNTTGGKKFKKSKSRRVKSKPVKIDVDIDSGKDFYGLVNKIIGGNRVDVLLHNGIREQVVIPGRLRKRVWFKQGNIVQVNADMEIVRLVNQTDKDAKDAHSRLKQYAIENEISFDFGDDDCSDEEDIDKDKIEKMQSDKFDMKNILPQKNKESVRGKEKTLAEKIEDI
jgi:initiation factor 1A